MRTTRRNAFNATIEAFLDELRQIRVLDPACGSGNFLYVALDRLLNLEKEVMLYRANAGFPLGFPTISPRQVMDWRSTSTRRSWRRSRSGSATCNG